MPRMRRTAIAGHHLGRTLALAALALTPVAAAPATPPPQGACVNQTTANLVATPYRTPDQALRQFLCLERHFVARGDRRAIFTSIYVVTTRNIGAAIESGQFHDPRWAAGYLVAFANLYRQALWDYEGGAIAAVPRAWRVAFDSARRGANLIVQDAMLGVNAHVTRDLPHALAATDLGPDRALRHADHTAINDVLNASEDEVLTRLGRLYAPQLRQLDERFGALDETLLGLAWRVARERAWVHGERLSDAPSAAARRQVVDEIEAAAAGTARRVRAWARAPAMRMRLRLLEGSDPESSFCARFPCRPPPLSSTR